MTAIANRFAWKCYCFQVVPKNVCTGCHFLCVKEKQLIFGLVRGKKGIFSLEFQGELNAFEELMRIRP